MSEPPSGDVGPYLPGWSFPGRWAPRTIVGAEGAWFWDDAGRRYLDFASQLVAVNLGHGNPAVLDAMAAQARALAYANPSFLTPARARLAKALDGVLPAGLRHYFFTPSGTEANEAALRFARAVTGRRKVLARPRSYHGATPGALAVSGDLRRGLVPEGELLPGTVEVPECYCYRCPLALEDPSCGIACAEAVEERLQKEPDVAAMIVEPVVGTNGVIVPVPEYLPRVREITRRHGVLLIADEVMTGWGRTGRWFAVDHWGVRPDLLTTAKGITSGYVPLGLVATSAEVAERLGARMLPVGHTYEAHPVAMAAAEAAIDEYRRRHLVEKSAADGAYLLERLRTMAARHPSVGEVRGLGLFAAIELVRDRAGRVPAGSSEEKRRGEPLLSETIAASLMRAGVYVLPWVSHLVLAPPLPIDRADLDHGLAAVGAALDEADASLRKGGAGVGPQGPRTLGNEPRRRRGVAR